MKFRSRKFIITVLVVAISAIGLFTGKLESGDFAAIISAAIVSYSFANAAGYFKNVVDK